MVRTSGVLNYRIEDTVLILELNGEIDHHSAVSLRRSADELIYRHSPKELRIDLYGIEFMDSSGLGFIMGRFALTKKLGGEAVLLDPNERITKIIELAGLERLIKIIRTERTSK